jgi:hypothetical protein
MQGKKHAHNKKVQKVLVPHNDKVNLFVLINTLKNNWPAALSNKEAEPEAKYIIPFT